MRGAAAMDDTLSDSDTDEFGEDDVIVDPETLAKRMAAFERDGKIDPEPEYRGEPLPTSFHGATTAEQAEVEAEAAAADAAVAAAQAAAQVAEAAAAATALSVESVAAAQRSQRYTKDKS